MTKENSINFRGLIFNLIAFGMFSAEGINLWVNGDKTKAIICSIIAFVGVVFAHGFGSELLKTFNATIKPKTAGRILIFDGEDGDMVALGLQLSASGHRRSRR